MQVNGACHCGDIAFTAEVRPDKVVLCHCSDCQIMSGAPYRSVLQTPESDFQLVRGEPVFYDKVGDSGNRRRLAFCARCGSHLYASDAEPGENKVMGLRTGTLVERDQLSPALQVWSQSSVGWAQDISNLPSVEGQP